MAHRLYSGDARNYPFGNAEEVLEIGRQNEERFFRAFRAPDIRTPGWFYGVRESTLPDDQKGIDAFAVLDVGQISIQLKSSRKGVEKLKLEHPGMECEVLFFVRSMSDHGVRCITLAHLKRCRERILSKSLGYIEPFKPKPLAHH